VSGRKYKFLEIHRVGSSGGQPAEGPLEGFIVAAAVQPFIGVDVNHPVVIKPFDHGGFGRQLLVEAEVPQPPHRLHR
jgi:hypothetical protein